MFDGIPIKWILNQVQTAAKLCGKKPGADDIAGQETDVMEMRKEVCKNTLTVAVLALMIVGCDRNALQEETTSRQISFAPSVEDKWKVVDTKALDKGAGIPDGYGYGASGEFSAGAASLVAHSYDVFDESSENRNPSKIYSDNSASSILSVEGIPDAAFGEASEDGFSCATVGSIDGADFGTGRLHASDVSESGTGNASGSYLANASGNIATRAAGLEDKNQFISTYNSFAVSAFITENSGNPEWKRANARIYIDKDITALNSNGTWENTPLRYWPGRRFKMQFFAYAPENLDFSLDNNNDPILDYTVNGNAKEQQDLLATWSEKVDGDYDKTLPLNFHHLMTAVKVQVGKGFSGTVTSVSIEGVYGKGSFNAADAAFAGSDWSKGSNVDEPMGTRKNPSLPEKSAWTADESSKSSFTSEMPDGGIDLSRLSAGNSSGNSAGGSQNSGNGSGQGSGLAAGDNHGSGSGQGSGNNQGSGLAMGDGFGNNQGTGQTAGDGQANLVYGGHTFMMLPQVLPAGATLTLHFSDGSVLSGKIGADGPQSLTKEWKAGNTVIYRLNKQEGCRGGMTACLRSRSSTTPLQVTYRPTRLRSLTMVAALSLSLSTVTIRTAKHCRGNWIVWRGTM